MLTRLENRLLFAASAVVDSEGAGIAMAVSYFRCTSVFHLAIYPFRFLGIRDWLLAYHASDTSAC